MGDMYVCHRGTSFFQNAPVIDLLCNMHLHACLVTVTAGHSISVATLQMQSLSTAANAPHSSFEIK